MTASQRVLFTALPNGVKEGSPGTYRISVHVSPKLTNNVVSTAPLSTYLDWVHWPDIVNTFDWAVQFGTDAPIAATRVSDPASTAVWDKVFGGSTVKSLVQPRFHNRKVRSYPAKNIRKFIRDKYGKYATENPEDYPSYDGLMEDFSDITPSHLFLTPNGSPPGQGVVETELENSLVFTNGQQLDRVDFYQLFRFHRSRKDLGPENRPGNEDYVPLPPPTTPTFDFHEAVSSVGQYPPLLRMLGLVVDLEFTILSGLPASPNEVKVLNDWVPNVANPSLNTGPVIGSVRTRCEIDSSNFLALAADPDEFADRKLPLSDTVKFTVIQEDLDGGGLKLIDLVANFVRMRVDNKLSSASEQSYSVPSLRSGGLSVARLNLAKQFHDDMVDGDSKTTAAEGDAPNDLVVNAEQITRGFRIDVRDELDDKWFTLTARTGNYKLPNLSPIPFTDEGWVTLAPTEDDSAGKDLYLQETLFQWGGWSLAAPRPGARLNTVQEPATLNTPNSPGPDFDLVVDIKAKPGSLPRLRFARKYRLRARAVDLAGNSAPLEPIENDDRQASPQITYRRWEPVQTPPVLFHAPRTQGESLENVILRSNYNTDPVPLEVTRHIVPPKGDQLMAEKHGLFDSGFPNSTPIPAKYGVITKYPNPQPPPGPVQQSEQGNFLTSSEGLQDPDSHKKVLYFPLDHVTLPYLPDPLARGFTLQFKQSDTPPPGGFAQASFNLADWPDYKPWRLIVQGQGEVSGPPIVDTGNRHLIVKLNKAETAKVRLSAHLDPGDLQNLGIWELIEGLGSGGQLEQTVIDGKHWMITPFRTLTLIHAVRQPLQMAQLNHPANLPKLHFDPDVRTLGTTSIEFEGTIGYSRKSTVRIDMVASWGEFVDNGPKTGDPTPESDPVPRRIQPFSIPGDRGNQLTVQGQDIVFVGASGDRQDFNDTKHRKVTYTTIATTRFAEYFTEAQEVTVNYGPDGFFGVTLETSDKGVVPGSVKVQNPVSRQPDGTVKDADYGTYVEGLHYSVDNAEGNVVFLRDNAPAGVPPGKKVIVSFVVPPIVRPGPGEEADTITLNIPSTSPPAAPKLLYLVPAFKWESTSGTTFGTGTSKKGGRLLRVFLERPWWSSGEGELLGVLISGLDSTSQSHLDKVTRWGMDPAFRSAPAGSSNLPSLFDFPLNAAVEGSLTIPGADGSFAVFGHEVLFDKARDLWYSDIEVGSKGYFPFIRLALVRYQPDAIQEAKISSVIVTDFAQLTPDRTVTVSVGTPARTRRRVQVTGPTYDRQNSAAGEPIVRITVERQAAGQNTDLGWTTFGQPVTLTRTQLQAGNIGVWEGQVPVVTPNTGFLSLGSAPKQRLVIEEFERHMTGFLQTTALRLVFSDVFPLNA